MNVFFAHRLSMFSVNVGFAEAAMQREFSRLMSRVGRVCRRDIVCPPMMPRSGERPLRAQSANLLRRSESRFKETDWTIIGIDQA